MEARILPATIIVTGNGDGTDGFVTLREAVTSINAGIDTSDVTSVGAYGVNDTINFNISGAGLQTISLLSSLPTLMKPVVINGYTQSDASQNTLVDTDNAVLRIELDGTSAGGGTNGLVLGTGSSGSSVSGLVINRFSGSGIRVLSDGNTITGNFIGTGGTGNTVASATSGFGIEIDGHFRNTIGGTTPASRNVIGGNSDGINLNTGSQNNVIQGNFIGVGADGATAVGNRLHGVALRGNGGLGVQDNSIGGTLAGAGNTIANNGSAGVAVFGDPLSIRQNTGNAILGNSIFNNGLSSPATIPGIDLVGTGSYPTDDGVTANDSGLMPADPDDADSGPNLLQNFPVLTSATSGMLGTTIMGTLNSSTQTTYRIEFFASPTVSATGFGEGQKFLGFTNVTTDNNGNANISFITTLANTVPSGQFVTATATSGGTSTGTTPTGAAAILGTAANFAILAGSAITITGPTNLLGDVGISPGSALDPASFTTTGTVHITDAVALQAKIDLATAYDSLLPAQLPFTTDLTGTDLGALLQPLTPGVYHFDTSAQLTGTLKLDTQGDPHARFVFQIGSTLITAVGSEVVFVLGGSSDNVLWQVGSSATIGVGTDFVGNILALTSITLQNGATLASGRALARNGAVTMNTIVVDSTIPPQNNTSEFSAPQQVPNLTPTTLTIGNQTVTEGGNLMFTVTLSAAVLGGVTVDFATTDGTAKDGVGESETDYTAASGTLTFLGMAGETKTITVLTATDTKVELNETLSVSLSNVSTGTVTTVGSPATGTITNNDSATISIADATATEGGNLVFAVTLTNPVDVNTVITFSTFDGSATTVDNDYTSQTAQTLTIVAGQTNGMITVATFADANIELAETMTVVLANISASGRNVTFLDDTGIGTINPPGNFSSPVITSDSTASVAENSSIATVVLDVNATDADVPAQTLSFALSGTDAVRFNINSTTGQITFVASPDFETPTDVGANNVYNVTVTATDNGVPSRSTAQALTITVTDVLPTLTINDASVTEGNNGTTAMTFQVTLSDGVSSGFTVGYGPQDGTATVADNDYEGPPSASLRLGSFNAARGGIFSLSDGSVATEMRSVILSRFPGATITGTSTLTPAFLANLDAVWLNSVFDNTTPISPLTAAEQSALLDFVRAGGRAMIFGENSFFNDESLLSPFGATTTDTLIGLHPGTISNTTHVLTNGPFGVVTRLQGNYPGNLSTIPSNALSLGTWTDSGKTSVAVLDPGALGAGSGLVVLLSDVNFYGDQFGTADNPKLMLNALSALSTPPPQLTFVGTTGEVRTLTVSINGDFKNEANETLNVLLGQIVGNNSVTTLDGNGLGTILNDDGGPPVAPVVNDQGFSLNENSANNTAFGTVVATDPGDVLTYSILSGNTGGAFQINSSTGQLTVLNKAALDFETTPTFLLTVKAQDVGGLSDTGLVTINLNDLSENGLVTLIIDDVSHFEGNSGTTAFTFTVTLSAATSSSFQVPFQTMNGTATTANNDYVPLSLNSSLVVGAFNSTRGGAFGLSDGASAAAMRAEILAAFPGATIVGTDTLSAAFLSTVNVVWLNSVAGNAGATAPLSAAEQSALQNFVSAGGGAILFGEHSFFDDSSFLSPFGLDTASGLTEVIAGTITNTTHAVTAGPFGNVTTISSNYPGNITTLGGATSLGTWNGSGLPALAVLSSGSGNVVVLTDVNMYADRLNQAGNQNRELLLNAIAFAKPAGNLQFAGTAGETHTIRVLVNGDFASEGDENFSVLLGSVIGTNEVTVTDDTGMGTIKNDDAAAVAPVVNDQSFSLNENSANNSVVGTVIATDPGDVLTYSILSGNTGGAFAINSSTGQLTVVNSTLLDFETTPSFMLTVKAQDGSGLSDTGIVTINLNNVQATLSINDVSQAEGNSGTSLMTFNVMLSAASGSGFSVAFNTQNGTATTANNDYVSLSSNSSLRVGAFNGTRGGDFSLSNGANGAAMRAAILANFPGATIVGTNTLDAAFLSTVNVVWLNSVATNTAATSPLTLAEQTALQTFISGGGGAIVFGEHNFFNDTSLLSPFNLATDSSNDGLTVGTITNLAHPVTSGPFGNVTTINSNFSGNLTALGTATSLGTWNSSGLSALAVLTSGSGKVVVLTDVNLYADQLAAADNQKLLLNALAFAQPAGDLKFVGTAGEIKAISVTINGDGTLEPTEDFRVLLTGITGNNDVSILDNTGVGTISNDDLSSVLQIGDALISERSKQSANATFNVTLSSPSTEAVSVNYSTTRVLNSGIAAIGSGPTATVGKDFKATTGTVRFAPGQMSQTVTVPVLDDVLHEGDETFFLQLSSATGAAISDGLGQATIRDNDAAPKLTITDATVTEKDTATVEAKFTVKLSAVSAVPVTVEFSTAAGTATEGADYQASRGTLTFNPGETSKSIIVVTSADLLHEASETFFVNLSNSIQAVIVDGQGRGTIKDNDKAPKLSIGDVSMIEGTTAEFTVSLSAPSGQSVTVNYATANGTAIAGREYAALIGTLTFAAGETSKTIRVALTPDAIANASKTFKLNLSKAVNALFADSQALATILDSSN